MTASRPDPELQRVFEQQGYDAVVELLMAREVAFRDYVLACRAADRADTARPAAWMAVLSVPCLIYMIVIGHVGGIVFASFTLVLCLVVFGLVRSDL